MGQTFGTWTRWVLACMVALMANLAWPTLALADTLDEIKGRGELRWGTDLEGGAPYVIADSPDPQLAGGFETEIGRAIAKALGVKPIIVHNQWDGLVPALERKSFDMVFNGLEVTPERERKILFTRPYYIYTQQIVVREDAEGMASLAALRGKRVGTLTGTAAERLLQGVGGVEILTYPSSVQPYEDLLNGRLDAVLQDLPIAIYYGKRAGLKFAGKPFGEGAYAIGLRPEDTRLKATLDGTIGGLLANGELKRILDRYGLWNEAQALLAQGRVPEPGAAVATDPAATGPRGTTTAAAPSDPKALGFWGRVWAYAPLLGQGALMTIAVSVLGMVLAIGLGLSLAVLRLYGPLPVQWAATVYVEVVRGTPLLVQLFLIYYGLPNLGLRLDAFTAAVLGLGLNYAAYEAEVYRSGLQAIPKGQMEAAMALGMSRWQALRHVQLPQAVRLVIPPVTNDFIALFKDSSVVSIITLVELSKAYGIAASATYDYIGLGLITAAIYFVISYPTSLLARALERRLHPA